MSDTFRDALQEFHSAFMDQFFGNDTGLPPRLIKACNEAGELLCRKPEPEPELADTHYEWELQDAEGEWQAGGSANSLKDVQREGARYLQIYSQDGPHKLIIQRHCVSTIKETTND